jgi:hypothetical protein
MKNTMKKIFYFGEKIKEFDIRVLNEREVRASAGILFLFAIIAFMNAWLLGNFNIIKIFVITFLVDFFIRIFINPKYSPSLIIGRFIVMNQKPEYVGAAQKRFAWVIGFILATTMFFLVIINNIIGPINLFICLACLIFLFFETSFGICLGCMVYNLFNKEKAKLCPGGVCEVRKKENIQKISVIQVIITSLFVILIIYIAFSGMLEQNKIIYTNVNNANNDQNFENQYLLNNMSNDDCEVPGWAIEIGHEEQYKLHHGCE